MSQTKRKQSLFKKAKVYANAEGRNKASGLSQMGGVITLTMVVLFLVKMVGFIRDILIVEKMQLGPISDGYYVGMAIPDLFYQLVIGGAIGAAITPTLAHAIERDETERAWRPVNTFFTLNVILMIILIVIGELYTAPLINLLNPGKTPAVLHVATEVTRIMFAQTLLFVLIAQVSAVLIANKVFGLTHVGNLIYSLISVLFLILFANSSVQGAKMATLGIVVGAFVYLAFLYYYAKPHLKYMRPSFRFADKEFKKLLLLAFPGLFASLLPELGSIVQQYFTNQFDGAITALNNALSVYVLPYGILVTAIASVLLPNLSGFFARNEEEQAAKFLNDSLRFSLFVLIPFMAIFFACNQDVIRAVYQWNRYPDSAVVQAGTLLLVFTVNLPLMTANFFYEQVFYAMKKSWVALLTSIGYLVINIVACYILINVMKMGLVALPIARIINNLIRYLILRVLLQKFKPELLRGDRLGFMGQVALILGTSVLAGVILQYCLPLPSAKILQLLLLLFKSVIIGVIVLSMSYLMNMRESFQCVDKLSRLMGRFRRNTLAE